MAQKQARKKSNRGVIIIALLILVLAVAAVIFLRSPAPEESPALIPDYAPEESEPYAEVIPDDTGVAKESNGGGSVTLNFTDAVSVDLSEEKVSLYFANPKRSNQDMILQILVQEEVIAQSELIPAGYQLDTLDLISGVSDRLREGGYEAAFMIHYYDQSTKARAMVNTNIPIRIEVTK